MSKTVVKIQAAANGSIMLLNSDGDIVKSIPANCAAAPVRVGQSTEGVQILDGSGKLRAEITTANITHYQVYGGTNTAFSGDTQDLLLILNNDFFFDVAAGQLNSSIVRNGEVTVNIAASANDLVIPNIERVSIIRLNAAVPLVVTGFVAPSPVLQQEFLILNIGAQVQLTRESLLSTAGNRFAGVNATETIVATNGSRRMIYDVSINRLKILQ